MKLKIIWIFIFLLIIVTLLALSGCYHESRYRFNYYENEWQEDKSITEIHYNYYEGRWE